MWTKKRALMCVAIAALFAAAAFVLTSSAEDNDDTVLGAYTDYDAGDVDVINTIIDENELDWDYDDPDSWPATIWNTATPKRIVALDLSSSELVGVLLLADLDALLTLNCNDNEITGLELPDSLTTLKCSDNLLTELDVSNCFLVRLECKNNLLTVLNVTGQPLNQGIICTYNYLTKSNVIGYAGSWNSTTRVFDPQILVFEDRDAFDIPAWTVNQPITTIRIGSSGAVSGGLPTYTFSAEGLPEGLSINSSGNITGKPAAPGPAGTAVITVTDKSTPAQTASITINYGAIARPMDAARDIVPVDIPKMHLGQEIEEIDVTRAVTGGTAPYTFSAEGLPEGITISEDGIISGTPTKKGLGGEAEIKVTDASKATMILVINYESVVDAEYIPALTVAIAMITVSVMIIIGYAVLTSRKK